MLDNLFSMLRTKRIRPDKLLWRLLSDSAPVPGKRYDLAVAYIEGGATYYVADHVNAVRKVAFVHTPYSMAGYTPKLDRGCYRAFNRIYAVSQPAAEDLIKVYPKLRSRAHSPMGRSALRRTSRRAPARLRMLARCLTMFLWAHQSPPTVMCSLLL